MTFRSNVSRQSRGSVSQLFHGPAPRAHPSTGSHLRAVRLRHSQSNTTSTDSIAPGGYSKSQNCRTVRSTLSQRTGCSLSLLISVDSAATQRETTPIARRAVAPCAAAYRLFLPYQYYEAFSRPVTGTDGCVLRRPGSGYVSYVRSGTTVYERVRSCQSGIGIGESRLRRKAAGRRAGTRTPIFVCGSH